MSSETVVRKRKTQKSKTAQVGKAKKGKVKANAADKRPDSECSNDVRLHMIAEAAYYQAEKRGFDPEGQVQDWLEAESMIEIMLDDAQYHDVEH